MCVLDPFVHTDRQLTYIVQFRDFVRPITVLHCSALTDQTINHLSHWCSEQMYRFIVFVTCERDWRISWLSVPRSSTPQYYKGCFTRGTTSKAKRDTNLSSTSSDTRETQICLQLRLIPERHTSVINFVWYPRDTNLSSTSSHTGKATPQSQRYVHGLPLRVFLVLVMFWSWFAFLLSPSVYEW